MGVDMLGSKRKGLFGAIGSTAAPEMMQGVGDLQPVAKAIASQPINVVQPDLKPKGGGFFGSDGLGTSILGAVGDYLMQVNGMQPTFGNAQLLRRQMELQQQRAQQQRQAEWDDWVKKQEYEAAHPRPVNNDTINDFNWFKTLSPQDRALYGQMKPQYITADNGDGTKTIIPVTPGMFGGQPSIPTAPVGKLKPLGGTAGNSGGSFR